MNGSWEQAQGKGILGPVCDVGGGNQKTGKDRF